MDEKEYNAFGDKWEFELMRLPKKFIINLYREACIKNLMEQTAEKMEGLRKALKFRPATQHSKKYLAYMQKAGYDRHHVIGKSNDYLIVNLTREEHNKRQLHPDKYFFDDLVDALNNLFQYIKQIEQSGHYEKISKKQREKTFSQIK